MDEPRPTEQTVSFISNAVTGRPIMTASAADSSPPSKDPTFPLQQAEGMAAQSIAQSMAIAIADATDMLRNISTIATTAVGIAAAKWIETPEMVLYKTIIDTAQGLIKIAAEDFATIGKNATQILTEFPGSSSSGGP